ncbi:unnamed protein product [Arabidopsis halleri]
MLILEADRSSVLNFCSKVMLETKWNCYKTLEYVSVGVGNYFKPNLPKRTCFELSFAPSQTQVDHLYMDLVF